jgi:hypothetical protein
VGPGLAKRVRRASDIEQEDWEGRYIERQIIEGETREDGSLSTVRISPSSWFRRLFHPYPISPLLANLIGYKWRTLIPDKSLKTLCK